MKKTFLLLMLALSSNTQISARTFSLKKLAIPCIFMGIKDAASVAIRAVATYNAWDQIKQNALKTDICFLLHQNIASHALIAATWLYLAYFFYTQPKLEIDEDGLFHK